MSSKRHEPYKILASRRQIEADRSIHRLNFSSVDGFGSGQRNGEYKP